MITFIRHFPLVVSVPAFRFCSVPVFLEFYLPQIHGSALLATHSFITSVDDNHCLLAVMFSITAQHILQAHTDTLPCLSTTIAVWHFSPPLLLTGCYLSQFSTLQHHHCCKSSTPSTEITTQLHYHHLCNTDMLSTQQVMNYNIFKNFISSTPSSQPLC